MFKFLRTITLVSGLVFPHVAVLGQRKPECERGVVQPRNWEQIDGDYVYFDYVLCPPDMRPAKPLVRIWITMQGNGIAVEKWTKDRDGADLISFFREKNKKYTLYRDLTAVPDTVFKPERRSQVSPDIAAKPFMVQGPYLVPLENLTNNSANDVTRAFLNADQLIREAEARVNLLFESPRIAALLKSLAEPPKQQ